MRTFIVILAVVMLVVAGWLLACGSEPDSAAPGRSPEAPAAPDAAPAPSPAIGAVPFADAPEPVADPPAGRLILVFHHGDEPVPGVQASVKDRPGSSAAADSEGRIAWTLPPGTYRWVHESAEHLEVRPARKRCLPVTDTSGASWTATSGFDPRESAECEVAAGRDTVFECPVERGVVLTGELPPQELPDSAPWNTVRLIREVVEEHPSGDRDKRMIVHEEIRNAVLRADRRFRFADIPPGTHILEAWWRSLDGIFIHRTWLTLLEDEHRDAGVLQSGSTVHVVEAVIRRGEAIVPPQELFKRVPTVRAYFDSEPISSDSRENFSMPLDLEIGRRFTVHGLPAQLSVMTSDFTKYGSKTEYLGEPKVSVASGEVSIVFPLIPLEPPQPPNVSFTLADELDRSVIVWILREGRYTTGFQLRPGEPMEIGLKPATYRILAHTQCAGDSEVPRNLHHSGTFAAKDGATYSVSMGPAGVFTGIARRRNGAPVAAQVLHFRPPGVEPWVYSVRTGPDGTFQLLGIPDVLEAMQGVERITPGSGVLTLHR